MPLSREEIRIRREPITDADPDEVGSASALGEEEFEVTVHAERPVVAKETVPVERVRVEKETVPEEEQVSADLRKEEIEVEVPESTDRRI